MTRTPAKSKRINIKKKQKESKTEEKKIHETPVDFLDYMETLKIYLAKL